MTASATTTRAAWLWPLLLVTSLQVLFTSGTWWITDHGEILAAADRFLETGQLELANLGPGFEEWTRIVEARGSTKTRFLPLSILVLTPFVAVDRAVFGPDPESWRFVHLQGHVCVAAGLALLGRHLALIGAGSQTAALSVLLTGLIWPVFMVARRLGPEPLLFALLALFATCGLRTRITVLLILPWTHATGPLLGLGALLWTWTDLRARPHFGAAALGWIGGIVTLILFWNLPVHGHLLLGGYGEFATDPFFTLRNPLVGIVTFVAPLIFWTLPLGYLMARGLRRTLFPTLALFLPAALFFGVFSTPEPERRLSPLLALWAATVLAPGQKPLSPTTATGLVLVAALSGFLGLAHDFSDLVETPYGTYTGPILLLLRTGLVEGRPGLAALAALLLAALVLIATYKTSRLLAMAPQLDQTKALTQNQ